MRTFQEGRCNKLNAVAKSSKTRTERPTKLNDTDIVAMR